MADPNDILEKLEYAQEHQRAVNGHERQQAIAEIKTLRLLVDVLKTGELYNGHRLRHESAGMIPQVAGWYACHVDDPEHKKCRGPHDKRSEAITAAMR